MKYQLATLVAAVLFVLAALAAGEQRLAAVVGAAIAGGTAVVSIFAMGWAVRAARRPVQGALMVMVLLFLVRLVLLGVGVPLVARAGANAVAFVVAFFVPFFVLAALEGAYLHSVRRTETPA